MQQSKPAHEQLTQYRDQLANDLQRVEASVGLCPAVCCCRQQRSACGVGGVLSCLQLAARDS